MEMTSIRQTSGWRGYADARDVCAEARVQMKRRFRTAGTKALRVYDGEKKKERKKERKKKGRASYGLIGGNSSHWIGKKLEKNSDRIAPFRSNGRVY